MSVEPVHKASCACGEVEFELNGQPLFAPNCCCNDCVTSAHYVDWKAKEKGHTNISAVEPGNNQSATMCMWPTSGIKIIKGKENIAYYKLRPSSKSLRAYTTCCSTVVIACPNLQPFVKFGVPFNRSSISPAIPMQYRGVKNEIQNLDTFPKDGDRYLIGPWKTIRNIFGGLIFGTGGPAKDPDTHAIINHPVEGVTEVAGAEAYAKCGFDSSKIK